MNERTARMRMIEQELSELRTDYEAMNTDQWERFKNLFETYESIFKEKLINSTGESVNEDNQLRGRIKMCSYFLDLCKRVEGGILDKTEELRELEILDIKEEVENMAIQQGVT